MAGSIGKQMFMAAHEQLIAERVEANPNADESKVYEETADLAYDRMRDNLADAIDAARERRKYRE